MSPWEVSLNDWEWTLGVNLWGVANGIRTFLPIMLSQDEEGHVVNTASVAGLMPGLGAYGVSKHAVVVLSEWLYQSLVAIHAKVGASVLCPSFVRTQILTSERNRPEELQDASPSNLPAALMASLAERVEAGLAPEAVAGLVIDAIREGQFWIRTETASDEQIRMRMEGIIEQRNPSVRPL